MGAVMPKRAEYKVHGGRAMLNLPGYQTTAAIVAEVEDTSTWADGKGRKGLAVQTKYDCEPYVKFQVANCDRSIEFVFPLEPHEVENSLYKIDTFIEALKDFRVGFEIEHKRYMERVDALDKKKKANRKRKAAHA